MAHRYYWLKLQEGFFNSKRIKKLRKVAGGDTYVIIYLKMQLIAMQTDGFIRYTGLEKTFAEELALELDEDIENVGITLQYLQSTGLIETSDNINFFLPYAVENTGSETSWAEKKRVQRTKKDEPRTIEGHCPVEKEVEKEKEKEIDVDVDVDHTDNNLKKIGGSLGQGVLMLSEAQVEALLQQLSIEEYNTYTKKLTDYILQHPNYTFKSHYQTILKWVEEDRQR